MVMIREILITILFILLISCGKEKTPQNITSETNHYKSSVSSYKIMQSNPNYNINKYSFLSVFKNIIFTINKILLILSSICVFIILLFFIVDYKLPEYYLIIKYSNVILISLMIIILNIVTIIICLLL